MHANFFLAALHLLFSSNSFQLKFCEHMCSISVCCNKLFMWQFYLRSATHAMCSTKLTSNKMPTRILHWYQITWIIYNALGLLLSTLPIGFDTYQMVYIFLYINSNSDTCIMSLFLILYCGLCLVQDDSELNFKFDGPSSRNSTPPVKQDRKDKERERLVSTLVCWL